MEAADKTDSPYRAAAMRGARNNAWWRPSCASLIPGPRNLTQNSRTFRCVSTNQDHGQPPGRLPAPLPIQRGFSSVERSLKEESKTPAVATT